MLTIFSRILQIINGLKLELTPTEYKQRQLKGRNYLIEIYFTGT